MNTKINIPEFAVSEFNKAFKDVIETNFNYVRIKGEISDYTKINPKYLHPIEEGNYDIIPNIYMRLLQLST